MPQKRILPFVILGILEMHPEMTGRDIISQFKNEIGEFWKASHSQIYPELERMTREEWLTVKTVPGNAKEKYYTLTPQGKNVLQNWLNQPVEEIPMQRDLFSLKLFFIHDRKDPRIPALIDERSELLQTQLQHLKQRRQLLFSDEAAINNNFGHYAILERGIDRRVSQLRWLQQLKAMFPEEPRQK